MDDVLRCRFGFISILYVRFEQSHVDEQVELGLELPLTKASER